MAYGVYSDRGYREHILERNKNTNKTEVFAQEDQTFTGRKTFLSGVTTSDLEVQTVEVSDSLKVKGKDITEIIDYLPNDVSKENKLTTEDFVNSSITTNTAYFRGTFNSLAELEAYAGEKTNNDYAFVRTADEFGAISFNRYKYNSQSESWEYEYTLNNSSFTAAQWDAINSGITAELVAKIGDGSALVPSITQEQYNNLTETEKNNGQIREITNTNPKKVMLNGMDLNEQYVGTTLLGRFWVQSNKTDGSFGGGARYANGIWVACSNNNIGIWYSTDGKNWTQSNKTDGYFEGGARYANGIWVACGSDANGLWYSTNGKNWTQSNKTDGSFDGGARYANGIWVACGSADKGLWYSTNGKNWTQSNKTDGSFDGGARYANGIWVACSNNNIGLWYSTDGKNWARSNKTDGYFSGGARYANGIWVVCVNDNGLWYSTDGKNWTQSNKTDGYFYGGARYANGIWVACSSDANGLWYSTDGKNWTQSNKTDGYFRGGARYANGIWVACNNNNIGLWYSTDGMHWARSNKADGSFYGGARYANGIWVVCVNDNGLWYSDVQILIDNGWFR